VCDKSGDSNNIVKLNFGVLRMVGSVGVAEFLLEALEVSFLC
jgi:hypothetical protein